MTEIMNVEGAIAREKYCGELLFRGRIEDVTVVYASGEKEEHVDVFFSSFGHGHLGIDHKPQRGYSDSFYDEEDYGVRFMVIPPEGYEPIIK